MPLGRNYGRGTPNRTSLMIPIASKSMKMTFHCIPEQVSRATCLINQEYVIERKAKDAEHNYRVTGAMIEE